MGRTIDRPTLKFAAFLVFLTAVIFSVVFAVRSLHGAGQDDTIVPDVAVHAAVRPSDAYIELEAAMAEADRQLLMSETLLKTSVSAERVRTLEMLQIDRSTVAREIANAIGSSSPVEGEEWED